MKDHKGYVQALVVKLSNDMEEKREEFSPFPSPYKYMLECTRLYSTKDHLVQGTRRTRNNVTMPSRRCETARTTKSSQQSSGVVLPGVDARYDLR